MTLQTILHRTVSISRIIILSECNRSKRSIIQSQINAQFRNLFCPCDFTYFDFDYWSQDASAHEFNISSTHNIHNQIFYVEAAESDCDAKTLKSSQIQQQSLSWQASVIEQCGLMLKDWLYQAVRHIY
jgi:outer membrane usher protein FimD/PapC